MVETYSNLDQEIVREGTIDDIDDAISDVSSILNRDWFGNEKATSRLVNQLDFISKEIMAVYGDVKGSNTVAYTRERVEMAESRDVTIIVNNWNSMYPKWRALA